MAQSLLLSTSQTWFPEWFISQPQSISLHVVLESLHNRQKKYRLQNADFVQTQTKPHRKLHLPQVFTDKLLLPAPAKAST